MKKLISTLSVLGLIISSYGQGYVTVAGNQVNSTNSTLLTSAWAGGATSGGAALGNIASGQSYKVAVLTSTSLTPITTLFGSGANLSSTWLDTGLLGANTTFAGRLSAGSDVLANNAPVGNTQSWILVAWSSNLGSTWAQVAPLIAAGNFGGLTGLLGWSAVGTGAAGPPPTGTPLIIQTTGSGIIPNGFSLLTVAPVPEPATIALAGLGGLSLLALRRRNSK